MGSWLAGAALIGMFTLGTAGIGTACAQTAADHEGKSVAATERAYTHQKTKRYAHRGARKRKIHAAVNQRKLAETNGYKRLSSFTNYPALAPGLGILYVKPDTLPKGPFLSFDRKDRLVATVYMIPLKDIDERNRFDIAGTKGKDDHVTLYFNSGHPGIEMPHYHVVIWHIPKADEMRVAK
jgi:hypothetical protein